MKNILTISCFAFVLWACNTSQPENKDIVETTTEAEITPVETEVATEEINSVEARIATGLMAAPEEFRANCTVIGYNDDGEFGTLKEGSNEMICLADDPNKEGFSAACYHQSLEPFMARGRELKAEGKSYMEIFDMREEEVKSGALTMGDPGATLHIYYGEDTQYNPETNEVPSAKYRYVVYMPWATSASTGLPESPIAPNHPWIMNPGTHRAHIMISPVAMQE